MFFKGKPLSDADPKELLEALPGVPRGQIVDVVTEIQRLHPTIMSKEFLEQLFRKVYGLANHEVKHG
jgi:hypothetical protein